MSQPSSRLARTTRAAQHKALASTEAAADRIDRAIVRLWNRLTALVVAEGERRERGRQIAVSPTFTHAVAGIVREMHAVSFGCLRDDFAGLAAWGYREAAAGFTKALPVKYLRAAAARQVEPASGAYKRRGRTAESIHRPSLDDFPDTRQTSNYDCGAASLHGICRYWGIGPTSERDFIRILQADPAWGVNLASLIRVGKALGLHVETLRGRERLISFIRAGWPVICFVQVGTQAVRDADEGGHYVTAIAVGKAGVRVQDPLEGPRVIPWGEFLRDWHGLDAGRRWVQYGIAYHGPLSHGARHSLMEDEAGAGGLLHGSVGFQVNAAGGLEVANRMEVLSDPDLSADEQRSLLTDILFPPLTLERVFKILTHPIAGKTWEQDLSVATKLADPNVIAGIVAGGFAAGHTPREVAKLLMPAVDNYKVSARRIARTYGMQVAHRAQMDAHAQLGDLVIGYTVHSAKSPNSRKWHVDRSGTEYYLNPEKGQKGMRQCPHPPLEAEDPGERPAGTPRTAWNCLCFLTPILRDF